MKTCIVGAMLMASVALAGCNTTEPVATASLAAPKRPKPRIAHATELIAQNPPGDSRIKAYWQDRCAERHAEYQARHGAVPDGQPPPGKVHEDEMCRRFYQDEL